MVKQRESLLWRFHKRGESRMHFLLGTMHVRSDEAYTPVAMAKHYMEQCAIYNGEMDLNDPELDKISDYFINEDELDLVDYIGEKKFDKYKKVILKSYQIDLDSISHYKPMVIANMIAESMISKEYDVALDHFLWEYAQALGMDMRGLESARNQFNIMSQIPIDNQLSSLKSCVKNVPNFRKKVMRMSEHYKEGQLRKLYKAAKKSMGSLRKMMIYDRNAFMAERLIHNSKDGASFTAVGAAHLPGSKGMIRLIKKADFVIEPILFD